MPCESREAVGSSRIKILAFLENVLAILTSFFSTGDSFSIEQEHVARLVLVTLRKVRSGAVVADPHTFPRAHHRRSLGVRVGADDPPLTERTPPRRLLEAVAHERFTGFEVVAVDVEKRIVGRNPGVEVDRAKAVVAGGESWIF